MISKEPRASIDLSHHLNEVSRSRHPSPLKDIVKYMALDDMVSLAGGLPHPSLFPFTNLTVSTYDPSVTLDSCSGGKPAATQDISVSAIPKGADQMSLTDALQYNSGPGDITLRNWAANFTREVFQPAYDDWEIILNGGNTDGWGKVVRTLCEPGDYILCEQHTYPSAQAVWAPMGCKAVPISMDASGLRADALEQNLSQWSESKGRRPRLLYVVPVGSNPTGVTMNGERRKQIYEVCVRYDVVIVEDDPYSFLQFPAFAPDTAAFDPVSPSKASTADLLRSLAPSFLRFDNQGRVIRLDSFSKTIAPGNRLGYFVANPIFIERLLRATEVDTQAPSGWSSVILSNVLHAWGTSGYLQWLAQLRNQYRARRDWLCNSIADSFLLESAKSSRESPADAEGLVAFHSTTRKVPIFSFVPPTGGMFVWARFYLARSPRYQKLLSLNSCADPEKAFQDELWLAMADARVLLTPGSYYTPWEGKDKVTTEERGAQKDIIHFRLSFSMTTKEEMQLGVSRMATVLRQFWDDPE